MTRVVEDQFGDEDEIDAIAARLTDDEKRLLRWGAGMRVMPAAHRYRLVLGRMRRRGIEPGDVSIRGSLAHALHQRVAHRSPAFRAT